MSAQAILLAVIGFVAGIASGMFGIGGGVIIVPALILLLGFTQLQANGTSLAALLLPVGIFAVTAYYRAGKLKISTAAWIAFGLTFGGFVGAELANSLPADTLKQIYGVFLLYMAWRFIEPRKLAATWRKAVNSDAVKLAETFEEGSASWYFLLVVGLIAGVASGMFGIGGGAVIVPILVAFLNFDQKRAVGTSLAALLLPVALPAAYSYYRAGNLDLGIALLVALGLVFGAFAGAKIALALPSATVKRLYGLFLLFVALRFILQP